uniref:E3 ubiquitin-protein ligase TRIM39-like n=1 Tax=Oreochromis aureus TaxID=47969 RepID=A0A668RQK2_OREAU
MSAASCLLSEDQFLCSICLDDFTDPVSIPCGHNFCKNCISHHWDISERCQCPMCKKVFRMRPELHVNSFISEMENLESRMCMKHNKPLELFCKTDQTCVCMLCSLIDHRTHEFVPLREEYEGPKSELIKTAAEIQQMVQKTRLKIQEIKESVKMSKDAANREKAEGVQVFTALKESVDRRLNELIKEIEDKQESTEKQAEGFIKDLKQEISELMKRSSEVEQISHSKDHLHLLQRFSSLKKLFEAELKRVQQYAVDVTLDPNTAHPYLILSDDGKQVHCGEEEKDLPDNPERFSEFPIVLGKQSFSSGRFYFEVQVNDKTEWALGVARESVNRKEVMTLSPKNGYWTVGVCENICVAVDDLPVHLPLQSGPQKVGVFVDYEEGLVSFHDVDDVDVIYSFSGFSFTEKLYPFFCPGGNDGGKNSDPLIICPEIGSSTD